jgi:hypothetical protein
MAIQLTAPRAATANRWLAGGAALRVLPTLALVAFVLLQAALYPRAIGIKDEGTYLAMAYILRAGTVFGDVAHVPMLFGVAHAGHTVSQYPPGESALLVPFTLLNWHLVFVANLALQVVGFLLFGRLLRCLGIRREWSILYLYFPALVLFSRTIMAEVPSTTLTVATLLLYARGTRGGRTAAGALLGLAVFVRYNNLVTFGLLLVCALLRDGGHCWRRTHAKRPICWQDLSSPPLLLGFAPLFAGFVLYNLVAYGHPSTPGYASTAVFSLHYLLPHVSFYVLDLLLLYPFMLVSPLLYRGPLRLEIMVIPTGMLLVMSSYYYLNNAHSFSENLLLGARLILPVVPLFLIAYAHLLDRLLARIPRWSNAGVLATALAGLGLATVVSLQHQRGLRYAAGARNAIYQHSAPNSLLVINDEVTKFINPAWGNRRYILYAYNGAPVPVRLPRGVHSVTIVWASQAGFIPPDVAIARRVANRLHARPVLDRVAGWHIMVWAGRPGLQAQE